MEKISLDTLLRNAENGKVSRKEYYEKAMRELETMDLFLMSDRRSGAAMHGSLLAMLHKLGISEKVVNDTSISYQDLVYMLGTCYNMEKYSDMALDAMQYFAHLIRNMQGREVEGR